MKLSSFLVSTALCIISVAAESPVQLNGWYPCTQDSLQADELNKGNPDQYYMETTNDSSTRRRATAEVEQTQAPSLPFLQQSFDRLFAQHSDWKKQQHQRTRHHHNTRGKAAEDAMPSIPQYECAEFRVPLCYDGVCESDNTIDVFVKRVKATSAAEGQKGKALWVLQGGPGASSTGVEGLMNTMYLELERQVSVYTFDHRGTGRSARLECQAAQAGALGSPGGSSIRLDELPACMDDIRFQIDNQTAAFSVTSAAKDLAAIINYELSDQDVFVYGLSYGTYLVERLVHFAPASVKGFSIDGIVSESGDTVEKRSTFSNWDHDVGVVGDRFLAACLAEDFCKSKFPGVTDLAAFVHELYDTLDAAVADDKKGTNACADALAKNGMKPSYLLRSTFGEYLMSDRMRIAIPAVIYRASRCTDQDADALGYFAEGVAYSEDDGGFGDSEPETLLFESDMLYYLIVFSEMWETPTPDKATLIKWYENSTMASDNYLSLPYYCLFTGSREHACQELIHLPIARPLVYERDEYWNKTGELPDGVTALLMTGGMDLQTRRMYGELEYKSMSGERMLVNFDDAGHCTTFTTPMNSGSTTCGVRILTSYVKENGVLKNVDTSCMDDLKPMKFSENVVGAQELFGTSDLYESSGSDW
ncbi:serine protease family S33, putative [Phytophthora infestans T30-4]|uniref:Serine protease family S33, putative n=1 Tax=Phytophthora infestans (strain T30-4) TaxID=403677 RepID=D0MT81_PHYIT|nr:serine protease family S33, putative [Phytophthora infestans T30-4]EEY61178.1 serine protease family S33, putative [Phytophthora infestans T30-4]|eukprot:XP_002908095.1 serine protease family S33, putative [Phytophthora infestans T30-4]